MRLQYLRKPARLSRWFSVTSSPRSKLLLSQSFEYTLGERRDGSTRNVVHGSGSRSFRAMGSNWLNAILIVVCSREESRRFASAPASSASLRESQTFSRLGSETPARDRDPAVRLIYNRFHNLLPVLAIKEATPTRSSGNSPSILHQSSSPPYPSVFTSIFSSRVRRCGRGAMIPS